MKVAISMSNFGAYSPEPLMQVRTSGHSVSVNPHGRPLNEREILALAKGATALITGPEPITREIMEALPSLRIICRCGSGLANVDLEAAKELDITVCNTADEASLAVAELTLGSTLDMLRFISRSDRDMRSGLWKKRMGNLLRGKKIGIVGYGRIGSLTARLFRVFGCEIAYSDPVSNDSGYTQMEFDEMLSWADIITLHCPANATKSDFVPPEAPNARKKAIRVNIQQEAATQLMDAASFSRMQEGSWFINTASGQLVDHEALLENLNNGRLKGAALDVYEKEPYTGALRGCENVVITPRIGTLAVESRVRMEIAAVQTVLIRLKAYKKDEELAEALSK